MRSVCLSDSYAWGAMLGAALTARSRRLRAAFVYVTQRQRVPCLGEFASLVAATDYFHLFLQLWDMAKARLELQTSVFSDQRVVALEIDFRQGSMKQENMTGIFQVPIDYDRLSGNFVFEQRILRQSKTFL